MKDSIKTANKFSLIFPMEKEREYGLINFSHSSTLLQTSITCIIDFINGIHKKKVDTLLVFELFFLEVIRVLANFTLVNITSTTN
jgi:cbb3-type cytochrome oxidase subunit 1